MKFRISSILMLFMLSAFTATNAKAWNCTDPLAARIDVGTTKPSGTAGDKDGQYFLGTGTEGIKGDYYVCQVPKTDPTSGNSNTLKQKQKQQQTQNQSQSQTANGGSVMSSGNSSNSNVNNSSSTSSSNSTSSATNNGNGSNNASYNSTTNVEAAKIPVSTAYAPSTLPTMSCFKTASAGAQTVPFGISIGGGRVDDNCRRLETASRAPNQLTFCKIYIKTKDAREAGVTLEDCTGTTSVTSAPVPSTVEDKKITNTPESAPVVPVQTFHPETVEHTQDGGDCTLYRGHVGNVCQRVIESVKLKLEANQDSSVAVRAQTSAEAATVRTFLIDNGVPASRISDPTVTGRKPEQPVGAVSFTIHWQSTVSVAD